MWDALANPPLALAAVTLVVAIVFVASALLFLMLPLLSLFCGKNNSNSTGIMFIYSVPL